METDVVIVGGGPVGLWTAIQTKKRNPDAQIKIYERYTEYQRSHVLKLENLSMLLYGKTSEDPLEKQFYEDVTGKSLKNAFQRATGSVYIKTNDLEAALKRYAQGVGVDITYETVSDTQTVMDKHPECKTFIAADGAHSRIRQELLGDEAVKDYPLQHVVEVKYQAKAGAKPLDLKGNYKTNKLTKNMVFEYVGREKDGIVPITLRFFVDKKTYDDLPEASFKKPLLLSDGQDIPEQLAQDIKTYMNVRKDKAAEEYVEGSAKVTGLTLSLYAARKFAVHKEDKNWFLVGDAAMGVPYFRALNSGLIIGSQLSFIVTRDYLSEKNKARAFNFIRPLDVAWEFTVARLKDVGLNLYDEFRQVSGTVPWETVKWDRQDAADFKADDHAAFKPENKLLP